MSRHRNIRNLTEEDYEDYYDDDYYDEEYYEEDEDEYYREQERQRKEREAAEAAKKREQQQRKARQMAQQKKGPAVVPSSASSPPLPLSTPASSTASASTAALSQAEKSERERLVVGMGFNATQAKTALVLAEYDVRRAIDSLLVAGPVGGGAAASAPPPGFSRPGGSGGGMAPPQATLTSLPPSKENRSGGGTNSSARVKSSSVAAIAAFDASPPPGRMSAVDGACRSKKSSTAESASAKKGAGGGGGGGISGVVVMGGGGRQGVANKSLTPPRSRRGSAGSSTAASTSAAADSMPMRAIPLEVAEFLKKGEGKSRLSMVVLGHVDAGKSTLMGQVLLQLGHVEKRTVAKYEKQAAELGKASFALAWVMDEDDSERERGVTMDIGTKRASTTKHELTILDAPGHADFVPAMISGAASADAGLLVVAATPGEFEAGFSAGSGRSPGGQTREHIVLARGLGVSQLVVAVNKLDAAEPPWSKERFGEIQQMLKPFLKVNGFLPKRVKFVPISGLNGVNIKNGPEASGEAGAGLKEWYDGPTLVEAIDAFQPAQRNFEKPLRLIVSDVYSEGKGVTARGRVTQGVLCLGDRVVVLPIGDEAVVGRIDHGAAAQASSSPYSFAPSSSTPNSIGTPVDRSKFAAAGDSLEVVLTGIDIARTSPGCVLSHPEQGLRPPVKKKFQAKVLVMEQLGVPLIRGAQVLMHMHSIDVPAAITRLLFTTKRDGTVKSDRPRVLSGGVSATVEITTHEKICMEEFSECRALGRFALRRRGDTIAVGVIEKILN